MLTSLVAATVLAAGFAGQALAGSSDETVSKTVKVSDLNLAHAKDARTMILRIQNAASDLCSGGTSDTLFRLSRSYRSCVRDSTSRAVAQLNSPVVTALYGGGSQVEVATK
jgi:UrcA family protein